MTEIAIVLSSFFNYFNFTGIQAVETMLYTLDIINNRSDYFKVGAHILDDCDKDTYGLEMAVDFIKGKELGCLSFIFE